MGREIVRDAVVVLATERDLTADHIVAELQRNQVPVARMDAADFPSRITLEARFDGSSGWGGWLSDPYRRVELESVRSVYFRRPEPFILPDGMSGPERLWAYREARMGFGGTLLGLDCLWVNDARAAAAAEYKPAQLAVAARCGLRTPRTTVTNCPRQARAWVEALPGSAVVKALGGVSHVEDGRTKVSFTHLVRSEDLDDSVALTSHCLQEWVEKDHEARVVVVGERQFAVAIHTDSPEAYIDWRSDYRAHRYAVVEPPEPVRRGLADYTQAWGLTSGAADFVVTPQGDWVFLELNPNGEWGWLAHHCELPIASALADVLEEGRA
jgi:ATP-grasp ribosomal peptide maturase